MRLNRAVKRDPIFTHEGAKAVHIPKAAELRRSVMSNLLWEDEFYEDGIKIADRIAALAAEVNPVEVSKIAIEARTLGNLRHVPLLITAGLAARTDLQDPRLIADTLTKVIQRADELTEFLAIYWRNGRRPLDHQVKRGLADALRKFDAYQLSKYDRDGAVKLRDVLRLVHPKPKDDEQSALWKALIDGTIKPADTWEVGLSRAGQSTDGVAKTQEQKDADKKEVFERQLVTGKMGYLALLRNLRNMEQLGVDDKLIRGAILARRGASRVLPFRFVAAARAAPHFERELDAAMIEGIKSSTHFAGRTAVLVDVSGSMIEKLSKKSDLRRIDAAAALASVINGEEVHAFVFATHSATVPFRLGMAGVDAIMNCGVGGGTDLARGLSLVRDAGRKKGYDRLIVITDEQSWTRPDWSNLAKRNYLINVASAQNGVGYGPDVVHIDGFSESTLRFIAAYEGLSVDPVDEIE